MARLRPFTPFRAPTRPPPNTYDPALDSQERAAGRGLFDLTQDVDRTNQRSLSDLLLGRQNLTRQRDEGLSDLVRRREGVWRDYSRLGNRQLEGARVAGVARGGALVQAARKRAGNQELDIAPIDIADTRLRQDTDRRLGALSTDWRRQYEDNNLVKLPRAQRELGFFKQDTSAQRFFQAKQTAPDSLPNPPGNEFTRHGLTYRISGGPVSKRRYRTSAGHTYNRSQWLQMLRRRKK